MSRLLPRSLRFRLILSFGLLIFLTLFLAGTATVYLLRQQKENDASEKVGLLADSVSFDSNYLQANDVPVNQILDLLSSEYPGVRILLVNRTNTVVADNQSVGNLNGKSLADILQSTGNSTSIKDIRNRVQHLREGPDDLLLYTPTRYGPLLQSYTPPLQTIVAVQQSDIRQAWKDLLPRLFLAGGIACFFGVIAAGLLARSITRPLRRITLASEEMARGNYDQQISSYGGEEVRRMASAFNDMARQVNRSYSTLRDFLANVSHELKTPLTSIQGFSQAMVDGSLTTPADYAEAGRIVNDESVRMRGLVDDLLYLSQLDSGEFTMQLEETWPNELLEATRERFSRRAQQAGVALEIKGGATPRIVVDGRRLEQALANIVDNAVRHTPDGGNVTLSTFAEDGHVRFSVHNTGSVIPPEALPHVFERFFQADPAGARADANTGLGLAITKEIVEAHGGHVAATSSDAGGTEFEITLPLRQPEAQRPS